MGMYVAMLRGVGPGDPNMTKEKFKALFEGLGFTKVQVVLASGNIIFESPIPNLRILTGLIEEALPQKLGFKRSVIVRSQLQLQALIDLDPFKGIEQNHNKELYLLITFFRRSKAIEGKPFTRCFLLPPGDLF